jgi:hypothetical protein
LALQRSPASRGRPGTAHGIDDHEGSGRHPRILLYAALHLLYAALRFGARSATR